MAFKSALLRLLQKALKSLAHYSQPPIYNLAGLCPSPFQLLDPPLNIQEYFHLLKCNVLFMHWSHQTAAIIWSRLAFYVAWCELSKGKDRLIDGPCKEKVYYRSAPCAGVKDAVNHSAIMLLPWERKDIAWHIHHFHWSRDFNEYPVEIAYLYSQDVSDNCRWIIGLVRHQKEPTDNLHNHPIHGPIKKLISHIM